MLDGLYLAFCRNPFPAAASPCQRGVVGARGADAWSALMLPVSHSRAVCMVSVLSFPAGAPGSGGGEAGNQARCPGFGRDSWDDGQIPVLLARMNGNGDGLNGHGGGLNGNGGGLNGVMAG